MFLTAAGAATAGAGLVVGVAAPTDWSGVAQAITALGVLIVSVGTAVTSIIQVRQKKNLDEIKAGVDGVTTKLVEAKTAEATATATLDAEAAERARKGVADAATLAERDRAAAAPPATAAAPPLAVSVKELADDAKKAES